MIYLFIKKSFTTKLSRAPKELSLKDKSVFKWELLKLLILYAELQLWRMKKEPIFSETLLKLKEMGSVTLK